MLELLSSLLYADSLSDALGELYTPVCACVVVSGLVIGMGAIADMLKYSVMIVFRLR